MIVFRTPKGWTCPKHIDGKKTEDSWRAHQVPLASAKDTHEHFRVLREWLRSYKPEELFTPEGQVRPEVTAFMPTGELRIGANPNANGGKVRRELELPDIHAHEIPVASKGHGWGSTEAARVFGEYTADVLAKNMDDFRIFGPDETASNRLQAAYKVTKKQWDAGFYEDEANDELLAGSGKVVEQLSEHQCEGFLEAYVLTGRSGVWSSYESFVHVVDSMVNQHCKWLEATKREIPWRAPISGLNILLSSHVWRQDHNGFSHQDPGFIDLLINKANDTHIVNAYYPADANMALAVAERVYQSTDCVNAIFCGKQPAPTFQTVDEAKSELAEGIATWSGRRLPTRSPRPTSWSPPVVTCRRSRPWLQPICCASWALRCGSSTWSTCSRSRTPARMTRLSATSAGLNSSAAARSPFSLPSTPMPARFAA